MSQIKCSGKSRGVVLVIVLVLFMALSGLTMMTIEVSSRGAVEASRMRSEYEAHFLAEEALYLIYDRLRDDTTPYHDSVNETWAGLWGDDGLEISIVPCNAKVNLNELSRIPDRKKVLKIMSHLMSEGSDVKGLLGSLSGWLGKPIDSKLEKLDDFFYAAQSPAYSPRKGKLETPEEVLLVKGWSEFSRGWIDKTFTVWGGSKLNINFASRDVLLAYFPELGKRIDRILHWRNTRGFSDLSQVLSVAGIASDSVMYKDMLDFLTVRSDFFEATVVASVGGCRVVKRYIISRPSMFETRMPKLVFQNDVSVTFEDRGQ